METALSQGGNKVTCSFHPSGLVCTIEGPLGEPGTRPSKPAAETGGHPRAGNSARASRPDPTALTVLVVEDEPFVSIQLQSELEHIGHAVVGPAANLASGLALAHSEKFDCALLDVNLGRETSVEIADELIRRDIPFAFVTGYTDGSLLPEALRDRPRIAKPHSTADLARVLRSLRPASDSSAA